MNVPATEAADPLTVTHDIVVIGASGGGVNALQTVVGALPADFGAAVFVVMHVDPEAPPLLPQTLARSSSLLAVQARDGMVVQRGRIHVAPPDCHLLLEPGRLAVTRGPRENRHRPAIDPLFRSAAWAYGPRVVGVVLSGDLDDGTAGLWAIKGCGGKTVVQDPGEAEHPDMPLNALMHNRIDHRLPLADIAALLVQLAAEPVDLADALSARSASDGPAAELAFARLDGGIPAAQRLGTLTPFTCPTCRGALWELDEGDHLRYRCPTGHAFSQSSLLLDQGIEAEQALYTAMRAVEEKASALRRLAAHWPERIPGVRRDYEERARDLDRTAGTLRSILAGARL